MENLNFGKRVNESIYLKLVEVRFYFIFFRYRKLLALDIM